MTPPNELEQLAEFQDAIQSNKGLERLRAMQYLQQMNNQGLMEMPQVTQQPIVQRQDGGMANPFKSNYGQRGNPALDQYNPRFDMSGEDGSEIGLLKQRELENQQRLRDEKLSSDSNTLENIYKAADVIVNGGSTQDRMKSQEIYRDNPAAVQRAIDELRNPQQRAGGGQVAPNQMAQGLAGLGRYGDNMLVHMNPEEVAGLMSLGKITYNPITGLPEAWGLRSFFKPFKQAAKSIKKVAKSKAFRTIAPLALTIAAPYLAASFFPATFGVAGVTGGLAAQVAAMGPVAFGAATAIGSGLGALAGGAKPKDALKAAALSGVTAGGMRGFTNYMDPNIDSVFGPTYGGGGTQAKALGNVGVRTGSPSSFRSPGLAQGSSPQVYNNPAGPGNALGAQRYENLQLSTPDITSGAAPGTTTIEARPFDYGATANMGPYEGSFTPAPEPVNLPIQSQDAVASNFNPGYSQTTGPQPNMLQRAGQQIVDSPVGQAVSDAGQYVADIPMGDYTLGDIGGAMYDDYGTGMGLAKLAAIDSTIPDYREQYAMEDERQRELEELEKLGYSVELSDADTGFNQTMIIRDSSGTVMPSNLSIQDILDRAYGRTPRTLLTDKISYAPTTAKHGGLINLAHGGEFSGKVTGDGHGMEDNVYMPIKEGGEQVGTLAVSPSEYVVDAYTMSALGNGNADEGAKVMDGVVESVRKKAYGTIRQPKEINGLMALKPMMAGV
jgi:hypothetical protein